MKRQFENTLKQVQTARALLAQALTQDDTTRINELMNLTVSLNAEMSDLVANALKLDDARNDEFLVFSEFDGHQGTIVPADWIPTLKRYAKEPMTIVRISASMKEQVIEALKGV